MQSKSSLQSLSIKDRVLSASLDKWESLNDRQKKYLKKGWGILTYKWRWQIAMNIPYLAIFLLDRSVPAVHQFNLALLTSIATKLPLPQFLVSWFGIG
mgnify:CR=1 FL=1